MDHPVVYVAENVFKMKASTKSFDSRFRSMFGITPVVAVFVWDKIQIENTTPIHLLMALNFLRCYTSEHVSSRFFNVDEKTLRKYRWLYVAAICQMKLVRITIH